MSGRALVVDANILVRAVLGQRVRGLIEKYGSTTVLFVPETAYNEAKEHIPVLIRRRGGDPDKALRLLAALYCWMEPIGSDIYSHFEAHAKSRLAGRDVDDWPTLASALALVCPIWTEDTDFFGCGVPTWTSDRVELFLREQDSSSTE